MLESLHYKRNFDVPANLHQFRTISEAKLLLAFVNKIHPSVFHNSNVIFTLCLWTRENIFYHSNAIGYSLLFTFCIFLIIPFST